MKMRPTRREFLSGGMAATTLLASGVTLPSFLGKSALAMADRSGSASEGGPILVVIEMSGGNDGLNTVVPFRDDAYRAARPTLAVAAGDVHRLDDDLGLHPRMTGMKRLFDEGRLAVIGNVGYPNPNRSHFHSMDVWHTASTAPETRHAGWLGRAVDARTRRSRPNDVPAPLALHLDDAVLPLALRARDHSVPSIHDIESFRLRDSATDIEAAFAAPRERASSDLEFVRRLGIASCRNARRLEETTRGGGDRGTYPDHPLGARMRQIARLIGAEFGPRIYYTSIGGFDTHSRQSLVHPQLLGTMSDSIAAFFEDLEKRGLDERVLLMTFSEFGRRVNENGSLGTDHGAAAPMFLAGPQCMPGLYGGRPDLSNLVDGDVPHTIDFRSVYAAILAQTLGCDARAILGERFEPLGVVRRG